MEEEWRDIEGYKGYFQVSNFGRVKSLERIISRFRKEKFHSNVQVKEKILDNRIRGGYYYISLKVRNIDKNYRIHRLVAKMFIPNPENKPQVNHKNGIKTDNRVENLEWCTNSENMKHAFKIGLKKSFGENSSQAKLNMQQIQEIRELFSNGKSQKFLAKKYNVCSSNIHCIVMKKSWTHGRKDVKNH